MPEKALPHFEPSPEAASPTLLNPLRKLSKFVATLSAVFETPPTSVPIPFSTLAIIPTPFESARNAGPIAAANATIFNVAS